MYYSNKNSCIIERNWNYNYSYEEIISLPVSTFSEAIGFQAGVQGLSIRGGGQNQTALMMNGFLLNDERSNNPFASISLNSIKEVQVQTGGFNAEYGNIRSGIINIITDEDWIAFLLCNEWAFSTWCTTSI